MRVGSYLGIPLKINPFFFLLLSGAVALGRLPQVIILFSVVVWHETAHVLMAKVYGLEIIEVELLPFGGVARLEALLQMNPTIEWIIAVVGPLSNLLLIGIAFGINVYYPIPSQWFTFFVQANAGMALFNLLPALPLDGGRILRSILVRKRGFKEATGTAVTVGQVIAVFLVLLGGVGVYLGQLNALVFVVMGFFVFFAAANERKAAAYVFMRYLTRKKQEIRLKRVLPVKELMATAESSIGEVFRQFQPPSYHLVWVIDLDGRILGFVDELALINALFDYGMDCKVGAVVRYTI